MIELKILKVLMFIRQLHKKSVIFVTIRIANLNIHTALVIIVLLTELAKAKPLIYCKMLI